MTGSYITHDGGRTWRMFNLRGVVNFFVFDPRDPKTMYAHATGLWRSRDGGETWALVSPAPSSVRGVKMNSDHADEIILAPSDPLGSVYAMAIDPADSRLLYVVAGRKENPELFVSRDSGEHWQKAGGSARQCATPVGRPALSTRGAAPFRGRHEFCCHGDWGRVFALSRCPRLQRTLVLDLVLESNR